MHPQLTHFIGRVSNRYRWLRLAQCLFVGWLGIALVALGLSQVQSFPRSPYFWVGGFAGLLLFFWVASRFLYRDRRWVAQQIETSFPTLRQRLLTAAEPVRESDSLFLRVALAHETIQHARANDWNRTVPTWKIATSWLVQFVALFCSLAIVGWCYRGDANYSGPGSLLMNLDGSRKTDGIVVEPGDAEVELGTDLLITARFGAKLPTEAQLHWHALEQKTEAETKQQSMQRSLNDPIFGAYLRNIRQDVAYQIVSPSGRSSTYQLKVFEYPSLVRSDASIAYPTYTNMADRKISDTRRVTLADGSKLTWVCQLNKSVELAELVDAEGNATQLTLLEGSQSDYTATFEMSESKRWRLRLRDRDGRASKFEEELSAKVLPNAPPTMKLVRANDQSVSPLQEVRVEAAAQDDFALMRFGVSYNLGNNDPIEIELPNDKGSQTKVALSHLIDLEAMRAEPDQLLSYYFWAEDLDRDGQTRRVDGEMFFAEVRPFEEIFRQGQSPSSDAQQQQQQGPQSGNAQQAEQLAELQKQIISATWNTLRGANPKAMPKNYSEDLNVIAESQQKALDQAEAMEQEIQDQQSQSHLLQVRRSMTQAKEQLNESSSNRDLDRLRDALRSEREAYEGLLRLRAREHQIVRSQQNRNQSSQSAGQRSRQQQIEQLQLDQDENRYEMEQKAQDQEPTAEREMRQVMNRLAELARRQEDLNEQIKELELALQAAKDEETKDKLQEQLDRLRDNQEELLRDSDELLERMDQPANRQAMEQAREQVEQARSELQKATESLSQGQPASAASAGARAQSQFDETRDQLRQQSSNQLEQAMKDLVDEARKLEQRQERLDQQMRKNSVPSQDQNNPNSDSDASLLRPTEEQGIDRKEWQTQKEQLGELLNKIQETVTEAESSEPLLAEKLYDSFRESKQKGLEQRLGQVPMLMERGMEEPALEAANELRQGIQSLRENVEEASEQVLGSEEQSLRRALSELEQVQQDLQEEIRARSGEKGDPNNQEENANASESNNGNRSENRQSDSANSNEPSSSQNSNEPNRQRNGQRGENSGQPSQDGASQESQENSSPEQEAPGPDGQRGNRQNAGPGAGSALRSMREGMAQSSGNAPLTGEDYAQWVDSLRDIEELVSDPDMKAEAARIRDAARDMRIEFKRHAREPQWPLVHRLIAEPLDRLRERVQEELLRKSAERNSIVPVDHDPVPSKYQRQLDRYYESLGSGSEGNASNSGVKATNP